MPKEKLSMKTRLKMSNKAHAKLFSKAVSADTTLYHHNIILSQNLMGRILTKKEKERIWNDIHK